MQMIDLIKICPYQAVEKELESHYEDYGKEKRKMRRLYSKLSKMVIKNVIDEECYVYVTAGRDEFDETDETIYYDVSAYEKGDDMIYSIASSPFEDFLQYLVDEDTLEQFTPESILAHTLWELTAYSFKDKN